jgi:hypothetical protein
MGMLTAPRTGARHMSRRPLRAVAADREGFSAQGRVAQFFNSAEEGIQVEVEDGASHW